MFSTRYVYACEPRFFHSNGLRIERELLPSKNAVKYFCSAILGSLVVRANPPSKHKCSALCTQAAQFYLGYPHADGLLNSLPAELREIGTDFESLLAKLVYDNEESAEIQSMGIRCLACPKYLEIIDLAIYL